MLLQAAVIIPCTISGARSHLLSRNCRALRRDLGDHRRFPGGFCPVTPVKTPISRYVLPPLQIEGHNYRQLEHQLSPSSRWMASLLIIVTITSWMPPYQPLARKQFSRNSVAGATATAPPPPPPAAPHCPKTIAAAPLLASDARRSQPRVRPSRLHAVPTAGLAGERASHRCRRPRVICRAQALWSIHWRRVDARSARYPHGLRGA